MDVKLGILIILNMAPLKNWSWHPVPQLEEVWYLILCTIATLNSDIRQTELRIDTGPTNQKQ